MGPEAFDKLVADARSGNRTGSSRRPGKKQPSMSKAQRLDLIRKRYDIRRKEIEAIRKSLETDD